MKRLLSACALVAGSLLMPVGAHEGENHGHADQPSPPLTTALEPRLEAASRTVELLAVLQNGQLLIYLDHFASNEPLGEAILTVDVGEQALTAIPAADPGVYRLGGVDSLNAPGNHELVFSIEAGALNDVLIGTLTVPAKAGVAASSVTTVETNYLLLGGAGIVVLLVGILLSRRRRRPPSAMLLLAVSLALSLAVPAALAHEGEDHGADQSPPVMIPTGNVPMRLPDGSLFMPKPVQRLLRIRTVLAEVHDLPRTMELNGHLIADPNRSGRVQATQVGRVEPTLEGLPHLGQIVRAGQVLAYLMPVASTLETANQQAQLAELNSQINLSERRLARLQQLIGSVAQREIDEVRTELAGLRKRRAAIDGGLALREPLRAPVDGVVSAAFAVAGQVVEARETLFEIINPHQWWVEAVVYDVGLSARIGSAVAQTLDGQVLPLRLLGMGYQRRSQGLPLQFRIEGEFSNLSAGQPARILAKTQATVRGVPVPRDSLVRGAGSEILVWLHISAERFAPRQVRAQVVDGATWVVTEGLSPGERVVSQGAGLLAQVR